jgi:short subunit dehydrogenase-like uncharacterized protein
MKHFVLSVLNKASCVNDLCHTTSIHVYATFRGVVTPAEKLGRGVVTPAEKLGASFQKDTDIIIKSQ